MRFQKATPFSEPPVFISENTTNSVVRVLLRLRMSPILMRLRKPALREEYYVYGT